MIEAGGPRNHGSRALRQATTRNLKAGRHGSRTEITAHRTQARRRRATGARHDLVHARPSPGKARTCPLCHRMMGPGSAGPQAPAEFPPQFSRRSKRSRNFLNLRKLARPSSPKLSKALSCQNRIWGIALIGSTKTRF
jgi:hypothetical protein